MKKFLSFLMTVAMLTSLMTAFAIGTSAAEPLSAKGYSIKANETADGWEHEYLYVVFSKDMKAPPEGARIAVVGNWTYSKYAYVASDKLEVISPRVWRFTHSAYLAAAQENPPSNSFYDQLNITDGYYPKNNITNLDIRIFAPITTGNPPAEAQLEAVDGEKLAIIPDAEDPNPVDANHIYKDRVHFDASGTNYGTGYSVGWTVADSVASIMPKAEEKPENPSTSDAFFFSAVALICTAGAAVFAKKKH